MERLDIIQGPFDRKRVLVINQKMEELAENREGLRQKWKDAILMYDGMEVMDEVEVEQGRLKTKAVFFNIPAPVSCCYAVSLNRHDFSGVERDKISDAASVFTAHWKWGA